MECFVKIVEAVTIFSNLSILDLWQGSEYAHLSISTHSLVEWYRAVYFIRHIQNSVYYREFRHIQAYLPPI